MPFPFGYENLYTKKCGLNLAIDQCDMLFSEPRNTYYRTQF